MEIKNNLPNQVFKSRFEATKAIKEVNDYAKDFGYSDFVKEINKEIRSGQNLELLANLFKTLNEMLEVLGLIVDIKPLTEEEKTLVNEWTIARQNKDFEKADLLRKQITELGIKM